MTKRTLCFFLLLPLVMCLDADVTLVKNIGSKSDVTPLCTNETTNFIVMIFCKIRRGAEVCRLVYDRELGFESNCSSRFRLMTENQTVFLQLTGLTPEDDGIHTCECSRPDGTHITHLNITFTVEEPRPNRRCEPVYLLIGAAALVMITGVLLWFTYCRMRHRNPPEPLSSLPYMEPEEIEPYSTFIQKENGLYSTTRVLYSDPNRFIIEKMRAGKIF